MSLEVDYQQVSSLFPCAYGGTEVGGVIKSSNSDFMVTEVLSFEPSGEGEHLFLQIEKDNCNTDWVAKQLQQFADLSSKDVGYAGKKDRYSVSSQWFSLHLPGKQIDLSELQNDSFKIVKSIRHNKKLRIGSIKENQFKIIVRELTGKLNLELVSLLEQKGFPNYFGPQRFGHQFNNLHKATDLLVNGKKIKNRNTKSMVLSSARSYLFNLQLAERVSDKSWDQLIEGDCLMLNNSQSFYQLEQVNNEEAERLSSGDTHVSGWMAGKQTSNAKSKALEFETRAYDKYIDWIDGLTRLNVDSARRAMRVFPRELTVEQIDSEAVFQFSLPKGCFATSLLREFANCVDKKAQPVEQ